VRQFYDIDLKMPSGANCISYLAEAVRRAVWFIVIFAFIDFMTVYGIRAMQYWEYIKITPITINLLEKFIDIHIQKSTIITPFTMIADIAKVLLTQVFFFCVIACNDTCITHPKALIEYIAHKLHGILMKFVFIMSISIIVKYLLFYLFYFSIFLPSPNILLVRVFDNAIESFYCVMFAVMYCEARMRCHTQENCNK
jgi:hypothetical protein